MNILWEVSSSLAIILVLTFFVTSAGFCHLCLPCCLKDGNLNQVIVKGDLGCHAGLDCYCYVSGGLTALQNTLIIYWHFAFSIVLVLMMWLAYERKVISEKEQMGCHYTRPISWEKEVNRLNLMRRWEDGMEWECFVILLLLLRRGVSPRQLRKRWLLSRHSVVDLGRNLATSFIREHIKSLNKGRIAHWFSATLIFHLLECRWWRVLMRPLFCNNGFSGCK